MHKTYVHPWYSAATEAGEYYNMRVKIDAEATTGKNWSETH